MNVVDFSGWLEYFADGSYADFFAPAILDEANLVVPTICMYEVFKRLSVQRGKDAALEEMELASLAFPLAVGIYLPSMRLDNRLDNRQPQSGAAGFAAARLVSAIEAVEYHRKLFRVYPLSIVLNFEN